MNWSFNHSFDFQDNLKSGHFRAGQKKCTSGKMSSGLSGKVENIYMYNA